MPPADNPRRACVCGFVAISFSNLIVHRRSCDSWREHIQGISRNPQPYTPDPEDSRVDCPYCYATLGNVSFLIAHLPRCDSRVGCFEDAHVHSKALARFYARLGAELAFDAYCREHHRES